jgi:hypothetical protein
MPPRATPAQQLSLRKFDPAGMDDRRVVMVIGKRNTGKSVLSKDLLYHKRHIPLGLVQSGTEEGNGYYSSWVPDSFIYNDFDKDAIERLIEHQRRACKQGTAKNVFIVLDDLMYDAKFLKDKVMRSIFMNGRHWNIFLLVTAQYCGDIPPAIRSNIDYVFVLRENILQNRERLYKNFFGIFPSLDAFNQTLDATTNDYECLVLDNTSRSNSIEDCVFWYKARVRNDFRMGSPALWRFHRRTYDAKHDQRAPDAAPVTGADRTARRPKVVVKKLASGVASEPPRGGVAPEPPRGVAPAARKTEARGRAGTR